MLHESISLLCPSLPMPNPDAITVPKEPSSRALPSNAYLRLPNSRSDSLLRTPTRHRGRIKVRTPPITQHIRARASKNTSSNTRPTAQIPVHDSTLPFTRRQRKPAAGTGCSGGEARACARGVPCPAADDAAGGFAVGGDLEGAFA